MSEKPIVLIIISEYLPGFKSGGPLRSIANLVELLSDEFHFLIITADRDLGDNQPYRNVRQNAWQTVGKADVYYCAPEFMSYRYLTALINKTSHDILYLNSFFSLKTSVIPLLGRRLKRISHPPVILAPRGQFSEGAFRIKSFRKRLFILVGKVLGLWSDVVWQASTDCEKDDIVRFINPPLKNIKIACNLPSRGAQQVARNSLPSSPLKVVFLSRITPKKNLDYCLECLKEVKHPVEFTIFGPSEDTDYCTHCMNLAATLPDHIKVLWKGPVIPEDVPLIIARHHLFFFPTRGENYGHVISEAISSGTPVLISDTTPWCNLENHGVGRVLPLRDRQAFADYIDQIAELSVEDYNVIRGKVIDYSAKMLNGGADIQANRKLFREALNQKHS